MMPRGRYPTPVQRADGLGGGRSELWIKRDDLTHEVYGGNKVRKLEAILGPMLEEGVRRVVTVGAVGSHHVLATAYFGRQAGIEVEAVLVPQPRTEHVLQTLRAGLGLGLRAFPVGSWGAAPLAVARRVAAGARFVQLGGSSVPGTMAYVQAARELAGQVRRGELPEPDVCVVALGSGGTAAGLAAGFAAERMRTRVVGACVSEPPWLLRRASLWLARACRTMVDDPAQGDDPVRPGRRLTMDARFLGRGYAYATEAGAEATAVARLHVGIPLDPTYTAKAFACALWFVRARRCEHVLYWHTLSSAPIEPLLEGAPSEGAIDARVRALAFVT